MMFKRLVLALLVSAVGCSSNFIVGDFVPAARKGQYHGRRTQWHDILGAHCPKFGTTTVVALPLLKPKDFESGNDYRLQLGFDNERLVTSWLQIIGRRAPSAPMVAVELVRSGDALVGVTAKVQAMPSWDTQAEKVQNEFADPTIWPKHLPIVYTWKVRHEIDPDRGLVVLFSAGGVCMIVMVLSVVRTYQKQLMQFVDDVTGDASYAPLGSGVRSFQKAD